MMNLFEKLKNIQAELKAPKDQYNSFGKYSYRNAESICEALKPLEVKYNVATVITDDIQMIGDRFYVVATVKLFDAESPDVIAVSARAREASEKKGMDEAQITGATSSYARKYALNGMFLLDDTKDVDSEEYQGKNDKAVKTTPKKTAPKAQPTQPVEQFPNRNKFLKICNEMGFDVKKICEELSLGRESADDDFKKAVDYVNLMKTEALAKQMEEDGFLEEI